jgi:hypothetical protein
MPQYSYTATNLDGHSEHGEVDALDIDSAREALRAKNFIPISVTESRPEAMPLQTETSLQPENKIYLPIAATLRLYAGWLLAYYAIVYAVGWYAHARQLPFSIPYVEALMLSPLVLSFTLAAFLFLVLHTGKQLWGPGIGKGIALTALGIGAFLLYRMNVA